MTAKELLQNIIDGDFKTLARVISKIENDECDDRINRNVINAGEIIIEHDYCFAV